MARPKRTTPWLARRGDPHNGTFYAFWYDAAARETKRLSMATADPGKAEVKFAEFLLGGREIRLPRPKGLTVALALADYMAEHVEKNCADTGRQEDAISHLKAFMGDRLLSEVDVPLSRQYAEARRLGQIGGGKRRTVRAGASSTIRRELNVLVAAANHAVWMKRDGAVAVSVDLPPEKRLGQDDEAPYYTLDELDRIFAAADAYDEKNKTDVSQFMHLLYQTGARRRSIEDLGRGQVRQREKQILLQKPGKRSTKKRQPIVPILKAMEPALAVLLERGGLDRLFQQADYYRHYKAVTAAAGVELARRHPHIMRHTRATHLLQDGKSLYDVARLLGDTLATVERVYGHHSAAHLAGRLEG